MPTETWTSLLVIAVAMTYLAAAITSAVRRRGARRAGEAPAAAGPFANSSATAGEYASVVAFALLGGLFRGDGAAGLWYLSGAAGGFLLMLLFLVGPLRRAGSPTLAGFAGSRLESPAVRAAAAAAASLVGLLYLVPQLDAAGSILRELAGAPYATGVVLVCVVGTVNVLIGGSRGTKRSAAVAHWIAQGALLAGVVVLVAVGRGGDTSAALAGTGTAGPQLAVAARSGAYAWVYAASLLVALACGTAAMPHVLRGVISSQDARTGRRVALMTVSIVALFCLTAAVWGTIAAAGPSATALSFDAGAAVLRVPEGALAAAGMPEAGRVLTGLAAAGLLAVLIAAFSALLGTIATNLSQDLYVRLSWPDAPEGTRAAAFRTAVILVAIGSAGVGLMGQTSDVTLVLGWAFALAGSTLFPLLMSSVWSRSLTGTGAIAGMAAGGAAVAVSAAVAVLGRGAWAVHPLLAALTAQPAVWSVPLSFTVMWYASRVTRASVPGSARPSLLRIHLPEQLGLGGIDRDE